MFDADLQPRIEASHDLRRADSVASAATKPGRAAALAECKAELQAAYDTHGGALGAFGVEESQRVEAVQKLEATRLAAASVYAFVRNRVTADIQTPDPAVPSVAHPEAAARALLRDFQPPESDLRSLAVDKVKELVAGAGRGLMSDDAFAGVAQRATFAERLEAQAAALEAAKKRAESEAAEATKAQAGLAGTRETLDRALTVYATQVEAVLRAEGRLAELGNFVLAAEPAYRARRAEKRPLTEEPAADDPTVNPPIVPT